MWKLNTKEGEQEEEGERSGGGRGQEGGKGERKGRREEGIFVELDNRTKHKSHAKLIIDLRLSVVQPKR